MTDQTPVLPPGSSTESPRWGPSTKFLVSLVFVVLIGALFVRFQILVGPLIFALILAYVLNPAAEWVTRATRLSWPAAVNVVYVVLIILLVAVMTATGIVIQQQAVGLYRAVIDITFNLPARLESFMTEPMVLGPFAIDLSQPFAIGPFVFDLSTADLRPLYDQLVDALRPALSRTGTFVGTLASGTASFLGWLIFILAVSYYVLHDVKEIGLSLERLAPKGYVHDVRRLLAQLGPIWNAFLRGQFILALVMGIIVGLTMAALGVRYAFVLGLLAGLLEFVPIVGPIIAGLVAILVALFQPDNWLGLSPIYFALLVLGVSILLQQLENNLLVPRILGESLNLNPVIILVGAVIAASLAGIVGLLLSAPTLATLRLFGVYFYRKLFDLDPWPEPESEPPPPPKESWLRRLWQRVLAQVRREKSEPGPQGPEGGLPPSG